MKNRVNDEGKFFERLLMADIVTVHIFSLFWFQTLKHSSLEAQQRQIDWSCSSELSLDRHREKHTEHNRKISSSAHDATWWVKLRKWNLCFARPERKLWTSQKSTPELCFLSIWHCFAYNPAKPNIWHQLFGTTHDTPHIRLSGFTRKLYQVNALFLL